jgi:hypothetical protein
MHKHVTSLWEFGQETRFPPHLLYRLCCCTGGGTGDCDCNCLKNSPAFYSFTRQVRWALGQAELQIRDWLGADIIPTAQSSEIAYGDKTIPPNNMRRILDRDDYYRTTKIPRSLVQGIGQYAPSRVVTVTGVTVDANSKRFVATVNNVPDSSIASDYIRWFGYHTEDNLDGLPQEYFVISPIQVQVIANNDNTSNLRITGPREALTMPSVLDGVGCADASGACFAESFELYQEAKQCAPDGYWLFASDDCTTTDCEDISRGVCFRVENPRTRSIRPAPVTRATVEGVCESNRYDLSSLGVPDKIRIYYAAGIPLQSNMIDPRLTRMVSHLAAHYLFNAGIELPACKGCGADGLSSDTLKALMNTLNAEATPTQKTGHLLIPIAVTKQDAVTCPLRPLTLGGVSAWHDANEFKKFIKGMERDG